MIYSTQEKKEIFFLSQVHQAFFLLGVISAIVMMFIFALSYKGIVSLEINTLHFHAYSLIFILFSNVFTGFLFTTFPKFCQSKTVEKAYYKKLFFATTLGAAVFLLGLFINLQLLIIGMIILFISQIFMFLKLQTIYTNGVAQDKEDPYWILMAHKFGLFGHFLFILLILGLDIGNFAINISFYMYLIFLTFSVGQRMIPFFSHSLETKDSRFITTVFILFLLKTSLSIFNTYTFVAVTEIFVDILLGLYLLGEFLNWKFSPLQSPPMVWILQLGLFWLPTAFILSGIISTLELLFDVNFHYLGIHLLALGFLTTVLIGFGTRVTLGHSGQAPNADRLDIFLFYFTQAVVLTRALYSINYAFEWNLDFLFDISFTLWLLLFFVWSARYAKVLIFGTKR